MNRSQRKSVDEALWRVGAANVEVILYPCIDAAGRKISRDRRGNDGHGFVRGKGVRA